METQKAGVWVTGTLNNPRSVSNLAYKGREPLGYLSQPRATPKFLGLREAFPGPGEAREPLPARPTRAQGPARTHLGRRPASAAPEPGPTPPGPPNDPPSPPAPRLGPQPEPRPRDAPRRGSPTQGPARLPEEPPARAPPPTCLRSCFSVSSPSLVSGARGSGPSVRCLTDPLSPS